MAGRASSPGDNHSLSDDEQRAWDNLTRAIGPLTNPGNPRDYVVADDEDVDAFIPPDPQLSPTPTRVMVRWLVLMASLALIVLTAWLDWPWYWALASFLAAAWAIVSLVGQLPSHRSDGEPEV